MNPYKLKNVFEYLTSNNQLLKKKLKLGTSEIPIPPKKNSVTTIEAINRFNKANPRVDTTNLKPLSVKHSNVRQSNVSEPNEGVIQGAYDTATREAQQSGYPAPSYDKFKSRYLKKNMKADGGRMGYKDGLGPSNQPMGPVYTTNKIEDAAKEVVKRLIKLDGVDIPLTDKISMSLGPDLDQTEIRGVIDILGGELNIGGGFKGDKRGVGFNFRKEFQDGGMLVQPSDDGSRPGYKEDYPNVYKNKQGNYVYRSGKGDNEIYRSGFKTQKAASKWGKKEFVKKFALPNKFVNAAELSEILDVGSKKGSGMASPLFERADRPKYLLQEARKILGSYQAGKNDFFRAPTKKEIAYLKKYSQSPVITEGLAKNVQIILNSKAIMNDLTGKNKGGAKLPAFNKMIQVFKKNGLNISDAQITNALQKAAYVLRGDVYQSDVKFDIDKNTGRFIVKELEKLPFDNQYARGIYKHALNEIRLELGETAGNLESFKRNFRKKLPDGFLKKHNLNVNEVFSVRASANNKSFPYAYFVDVIDADLNKKDLRSFHGALSKAQKNLNDKINDIRAGKGKYDEAVDIVNKFQETRGKFKNTIETNYPNKNFNLADIVLGKESEIVKQNMKIPENVYSKKLLTKWADQGLDIAKDAKSRGFVMTGADSPTVYTAKDLSSTGKIDLNAAKEKFLTNLDKNKFRRVSTVLINAAKEGGFGETIQKICMRKQAKKGGRMFLSNGSGCPAADQDPKGFLKSVSESPGLKKFFTSSTGKKLAGAAARVTGNVLNPTTLIGGEVAFVLGDGLNNFASGLPLDESFDRAFVFGDFGKFEKNLMNKAKELGYDQNQLNLLQETMNINKLDNREKKLKYGLDNETPGSEDLIMGFSERLADTKNQLDNSVQNYIGTLDKMGFDLNKDSTYDVGFRYLDNAFKKRTQDQLVEDFKDRERQVDPTKTPFGNFISPVFDLSSYTQPLKYGLDIINPFTKDVPFLSEQQQEAKKLRDMSQEDLDIYNKNRKFTLEDIQSGESPYTRQLMDYLGTDVTGQGFGSQFLASGGIASLTKTIPPESGPTPHGLPYVYNNVKKI